MTIQFTLNRGDTPKLKDVLFDTVGAVNLTGATVELILQVGKEPFTRSATVTDAPAGKVEYQMVAEDTAQPGLCFAQWRVVNGAITRTFPTGIITFEVLEGLPFSVTANTTPIADLYELVRATLGDLHRTIQKYSDSAILAVIRTVVRTGGLPGYALTPDGRAITPALATPKDFAVVMLRASLKFLLPNAAAYAYDTRALKERFGEQRLFLIQLQQELYEAEEDGGPLVTFNSFYAWVSGNTGLNLYATLSTVNLSNGLPPVNIIL